MNGALRALEWTGSLGCVAVVLALGILQGIQTQAISFHLAGVFVEIVMIKAVPTTIIFSILVGLSGLLLAYEVHGRLDPDERRVTGPRFTAIVPVYRDAAVLSESVETLLQSNYANLEVAIVAEPGDEETIEAARSYAQRPNVRVLINGNESSKAGAINYAVEQLDCDYFGAFDVDERIDPAFVPAAMYQLTYDKQDIFQVRRVPRVTGPVEALAYGERLLFHASYKLVELAGFTYCRTSSCAFTREAFEAVGGLDPVVTEDIDFAHKCFRADLRVRQARNLTNEMEAPHTLRDLWGQRKRWRLGHIEVFLKALRGGFSIGGVRGALSTGRLTMSLGASVLLVALLSKFVVLFLLDLELLFLLPLVAISLTAGPVLYWDYRRGHIKTITPAFVLIPLIYPGFGLVTIRCAFEYALSWDGEWYTVQKAGA